MLDPSDSPFPLLPTFKIAGTAIRCACVVPLAPSVAGNLNLAATGRPKGIQISISPDHLKLICHLVSDVDDVFKSVQNRASGRNAAEHASVENSIGQVCTPFPPLRHVAIARVESPLVYPWESAMKSELQFPSTAFQKPCFPPIYIESCTYQFSRSLVLRSL